MSDTPIFRQLINSPRYIFSDAIDRLLARMELNEAGC